MVGWRFLKKIQSTNKTTASVWVPVAARMHLTPGKLWYRSYFPSKFWYVLILSFSVVLILGGTGPVFLNSQPLSDAWWKKGRGWCNRKWVVLSVLILLIPGCGPERIVRVEEELHNHHVQHELSKLMLLDKESKLQGYTEWLCLPLSKAGKDN